MTTSHCLRITSVAIVCGSLLCVASAQASIYVTAKFDSRGPLGSAGVKLFDATSGGTLIEAVNTNQAGLFKWTTSDPDAAGLVNGIGLETGNFISFCIEITQTVGVGATYTNMELIPLKEAPKPGTVGLSPMNDSGANAIAKLWANFLDDALLGLDPVKIAAFQLAIWKLAYDEGTDFTLSKTTGRLRVDSTTSSVVVQAQTWLTSISSLLPTAPPFATDYLFGLTKGSATNFQDQVVGKLPPSGSPPPHTVPEATSLMIWGLLSCSVGLVVARRRGC
jgi:hypothetical protein